MAFPGTIGFWLSLDGTQTLVKCFTISQLVPPLARIKWTICTCSLESHGSKYQTLYLHAKYKECIKIYLQYVPYVTRVTRLKQSNLANFVLKIGQISPTLCSKLVKISNELWNNTKHRKCVISLYFISTVIAKIHICTS